MPGNWNSQDFNFFVCLFVCLCSFSEDCPQSLKLCPIGIHLFLSPTIPHFRLNLQPLQPVISSPSLWLMHKTSSSPAHRNWKEKLTLQRKIVPPNSIKVYPGTISKSLAPWSMLQSDILIKVSLKKSQRGNERKKFLFQAAEGILFVGLHADERDLNAKS